MSDVAPEPLPTYVIDAHVAAGEGWLLSRGRLAAAGEPALLVREVADDVVGLRRGLAIAGSVGGRHLATVCDVQAIDAMHAVVALAPPGGPSLAELAAERGSLAVGEVVTLVAPLATTIATLHARGLELGDVTAATVWLAADGRPVLLPVGCREVPDRRDSCRVQQGAVAALAATALAVLDRTSAGAAALVSVLEGAIDGRLDAGGLATAVRRCAEPMPIGGAVQAPRPRPDEAGRHLPRGRRRAHRRRRQLRRMPSRLRPFVLVVVVAAVAVGLGGFWGHHDDGAVFAAPPVHAWRSADGSTSTSTAAPSWRAVMTALENRRARAYATGDAPLLATVYADGSPTGRSDLDVFRGLVRRGQHAAGLRAFVERVTVITATASRVTLEVADALTAYDIVGSAGRIVRHGTGRPTQTWRVTMTRTAAGWRVWLVAAH